MTDEIETESPTRDPKGLLAHMVTGLCLVLSVGHLYLALFPVISEFERNVFHFAGFALLAALLYPVLPRAGLKKSRTALAFDIALGVIAVSGATWMALAENAIYDRGVRLSTLDYVAAIATILAGIELTRRVSGMVIPVLIVLSLTYVGWWGSLIDGVFSFRGLSWETVLFRSMYGDDAMFGTIARISSTYVFLFIIFGAFLIRSGAGEFVIDLARAIAGKLVGGPGLVAVIASGLTGTISGSAIANTASTGVITIPLMKRAGFPSKFAGGVEAASSTGGQLMPPIMGAGAFVMASFTQISYETIVAVAALPALLYFLTVAFFVRIEAKRQNLKPMESDGTTLWMAVKRGGASFIIPIAVLIFLLVSGFTPTYAAVIGIGAVIVSSWLTQNPMGPRAIFEALVMGARNMVMTAVLLCAVGLVVNVITTAGIGNTFSLMIANWANGNLLLAIFLIAIASLVLGMGLPVTAAYIVLATLSAPALAGMIADRVVVDAVASGTLPMGAQALFMLSAPEAVPLLAEPMAVTDARALVGGLPLEVAAPLRDMVVPPEAALAALLSAHMIIFWLSQDSNVTPPVALAAFTAATIAKSPPMATGVASWKLAKGLYIVPVLFAYTDFLSGNWGDALTVFAFGVVGTYALAGALQGCMERPIGLILRVFVAIAGLACLWPDALIINVMGVALVATLVVLNARGVPLASLRTASGGDI
ncbi:TRAP transporter permease [Pontivivens insulae]|uniref:C4-dicarboxylate TRAP transporter large permease protein DctM n=1 Tax=Pontivivens insulae TaxID=1639689 RepID=A0A2R8ACQ7_9RHOB|nr:TRAP transporter fused permease subunit [Pontivivens insulae]RED13959.1 TRAP transporter 4TM/12TM fusion protein [Pontivivens insulae]SPF30033.1 C4-dicarboxylate TRAP transporter large permease protein DctM [Pontivivens insulae]